jgi:hypothetical protein
LKCQLVGPRSELVVDERGTVDCGIRRGTAQDAAYSRSGAVDKNWGERRVCGIDACSTGGFISLALYLD